ncbi:MAG: HD domain-containing protein [Candidatus Uhrbacteria bacterium]|nr:HD domain-containing protein [Candidatus Uhrbacteria bacterium]
MPPTLPPSTEFHRLATQEERFFELLRSFSPADRAIIKEAYIQAKDAHKPQMRDDGTAYILHPLRATISLISECDIKNTDILCAMLLHDVVEDTHVTLSAIEKLFGGRVAALVSNVTRQRTDNPTEDRVRKDKAEKFEKLLTADEETRLIKCADILDNIRSWPNIPCDSAARKKLPRWFDETRIYALPLAQKTNAILFKEITHAFSYAQANSESCPTAIIHSL